MVAKLYCQDYVIYAHVYSTLISALNALHRLIKIMMVHVTSKIIVLFNTYLLEDEQELSFEMLDTSQTYL
jgi:hypothetical protein